jgi:hypothetical protein
MSEATLMPAVLYLAGSNLAAAVSTAEFAEVLVGVGVAVAQAASNNADAASTEVIPRIFFNENAPKVFVYSARLFEFE